MISDAEDPTFLPRLEELVPVPFDLELLDRESVAADRGANLHLPAGAEPGDDFVALKFGVTETVWYPAEALVPKREYEAVFGLFPQLDRENLPLGLMMQLVASVGGTVVVDERRGDVQGQVVCGPVEEGDS